jgi:hypothetical protein
LIERILPPGERSSIRIVRPSGAGNPLFRGSGTNRPGSPENELFDRKVPPKPPAETPPRTSPEGSGRGPAAAGDDAGSIDDLARELDELLDDSLMAAAHGMWEPLSLATASAPSGDRLGVPSRSSCQSSSTVSGRSAFFGVAGMWASVYVPGPWLSGCGAA